jgi:hypothetical protein
MLKVTLSKPSGDCQQHREGQEEKYSEYSPANQELFELAVSFCLCESFL